LFLLKLRIIRQPNAPYPGFHHILQIWLSISTVPAAAETAVVTPEKQHYLNSQYQTRLSLMPMPTANHHKTECNKADKNG
jgi:hypothetical protein